MTFLTLKLFLKWSTKVDGTSTSRKGNPTPVETRTLYSTGRLLRKAGHEGILRERRKAPVDIRVDGHTLRLGDQAPLYPGNIHFEDSWTFDDLVHANPGRAPWFCPYNSGSPRCVAGRKSPRGPHTFRQCHETAHSPAATAELTYLNDGC